MGSVIRTAVLTDFYVVFAVFSTSTKTALKIQWQSCQTIQILILNLLTIKTDLYLLPISEASESNFSVRVISALLKTATRYGEK